jgi:hypothetical protein
VHQSSSADQAPPLASMRNSVFLLDRFLLLLLLILFVALPSVAQSEWELYGGTSFLWVKTSPDLTSLNLNSLNDWGWQTDISEYPWRWFGGTLESGGFYGHPNISIPANYISPGNPATNLTITNAFNAKTYTFMFGPTFAYNRNLYVQPFGHVPLGGIDEQYSLISKFDPRELFGGPIPNTSQWIFGWALGGGADIRVSRLVAIRGPEPKNAQLKFEPLPTNAQPSSDGSGNSAAEEKHQQIAQSSTPAFQADQESNSAFAVAPVPTSSISVAKAEQLSVSAPASPTSGVSQNTFAATHENSVVAAPHTAGEANQLQPGGGSAQQPFIQVPVPATATPAPTAPGQQPAVMVEFWSSPMGADVEIDGQYVGSTYSIVAVLPGEHTIVIRKQDFATWQRTMRVTSGDARVAAYLERMRATITFH